MTAMPAATGHRDRRGSPQHRFGAGGDGEHGGYWWCALPDIDAAADAAAVLLSAGSVLAGYASGRPWVIGRHRRDAVRVVLLGGARAVMLGECLATDGQFGDAAGRGIGHVMDLPGSFHALIARPGGLVAAGDVAGFRRLFTARVHGVPVLASHARVLRRLVDAPVDRTWLACRLASPEMPSVLRGTLSPFTGVTPVPAGYCAEITGTICRTARWWTPPSAGLPLAAGATLLREALTAAVTGRIGRAARPVSVQLSGGLDSTALAALASPVQPLLIVAAGRSPADDDLWWARRAAELLPGCPHRVMGADEAPPFFAGLDIPVLGADEPAPFAAGAARQRHTARLLAGYGPALHLNGQGGDEVLLAPLAYLRAALQTAPRTGIRHLCGHAALKGIPVPSLARAAIRRESFAEWLRRCAGTLCAEPPASYGLTGWEAPPVLPPWATAEAAGLVASATRAAEPVPAAGDQATHAALVRIRASAYRAGLYRDAMAAAGVPVAMPFFDRAVVEACLSVLPWERTDPWQPKPLLRAALSGVVPENLLCRRTKGTYNADIHHGWSVCRGQVAELLADPRLATLGLINLNRMRQALAAFGPGGLPPAWVTDLIAIETWLRDLDFASPQAPSGQWAARAIQPLPEQTLPPVRLTGTIRTTLVGDGITLLETRRGTLYHLNRAGALILAALADTADAGVAATEAAVTALAARYDIPVEQARADVAALLSQLRDHGLLTHQGQAS